MQVLLIQDIATSFFIYCFTLTFTSAVFTFHNFLELHSTLNLKKDFHHKFLFWADSIKPTHPLNSQNLQSIAKVACWCSPKKMVSETSETPIKTFLQHFEQIRLQLFCLVHGSFALKTGMSVQVEANKFSFIFLKKEHVHTDSSGCYSGRGHCAPLSGFSCRPGGKPSEQLQCLAQN